VACTAQQLSSTARSVIGLTGHPPLSNYDHTTVGLGGFVTSKGWIELGNPVSVKISLKLFNINNCSARASSVRASSSDPSEFVEVTSAAAAHAVFYFCHHCVPQCEVSVATSSLRSCADRPGTPATKKRLSVQPTVAFISCFNTKRMLD